MKSTAPEPTTPGYCAKEYQIRKAIPRNEVKVYTVDRNKDFIRILFG